MLLRHTRPRVRGRWICYGLGLACAGGLAISGCSRTPLVRTGDAPANGQAGGTEQPRLVDRVWGDRASTSEGVAGTRSTPAATDERWVRFGGRDGSSPAISEGFANWRKSLFSAEPERDADPFLDPQRPSATATERESLAAASAGTRFPSTSTLSGRSVTSPEGVASTRPYPSHDTRSTDGVAQIHSSSSSVTRDPHIDTASLTQRATDGIARTSSGSTQASRLEELRAELRREQEAEEAATVAASERSSATDAPRTTDRGVLLSESGGASQFPRMSTYSSRTASDSVDRVRSMTQPAGEVLSQATTSPSTEPAGATSPEARPRSSAISPDEAAVRIQSLLAAAEWQLQRGEHEEAYRSAILAQKMADTTGVEFSAGDRRPSELASRVWKEMREQEGGETQLAAGTARSEAAGSARTEPVARTVSRADGDAVFAGQRGPGWQGLAAGTALAIDPQASDMPIVQPRAVAGRNAPLTVPDDDGTAAPSAADPQVRLTAELDTNTERPETQAATGQPATTPNGLRGPARFTRRDSLKLTGAEEDDAGVIQADGTELADARPARARTRRPAPANDPALASLSRPQATGGPALRGGPRLPAASTPAATLPPVPPTLEVAIADRLARQTAEIDEPAANDRGFLWGAAGLLGGAVLAVFALRRNRPLRAGTESPAAR